MTKITVQELIDLLRGFSPSAEIVFSDGLPFYRVKSRGENRVQIEFDVVVYKDLSGKWFVVPEESVET